MFEVLAELLAELIFAGLIEGLLPSSSATSSKKVKIWHAFFRTTFYLLATGLFVLLALGATDRKQLIYGFIGVACFGAMIKTNWTSYQRHKKWQMRQKNVNTHKASEKKGA